MTGGLVPTIEPYQKSFNQGMILAYSYRDEKGKYYHPSEVETRREGDSELFCQRRNFEGRTGRDRSLSTG